jgi:competence protein ComEC
MGAAVLIGLWLGHGKVEVFAALFLALFIHLVLEPYAILSLSFQLSYLAVLGMAVVLPKVSTPKGWKGWAISALLITLAAQVFILPILLHQFHQLPLISPLANLVVLPLLNLLVPLGFIKMFLGGLLALPYEWAGQLTLWLVGLFAKGPQLYWGQISPVGFGLYYLALLPLLAGLYRQISWRRMGVLGGTAALASMASLTVPQAEIWQLDVGQGDASLIRLPGNIEVLVDGGRGFASNRVIGALRALGVDDIDVIIATHADADHIQALPEVLHEFPVGTLFTGPVIEGDIDDIALRENAEERNIRTLEARVGTVVKLGQATLRFVGPQETEGQTNDLSLVFVLEYGGRRALFTGDAPDWAEATWQAGPIDILKVGHHGSRSSTGEELLSQTRPSIALIGVGPNTYGHPTREVLERLERYGVQVHRTDQEGAIQIGLSSFWSGK